MDNWGMSICIVIPFYNEEKRLGDCAYLKDLNQNPEIDYLFVDDGSTDGTLAILRSEFPDREIVTYGKNKGKGGAIREGLLRALEKDYTMVGYLDSDGAFTSNDVGRVVSIARNIFSADESKSMVIGSRIKTKFNSIERTMIRSIASYFVKAKLNRYLREFESPPFDTQSGFKLLRSSVQLGRFLENEFKTKWFFDVEIMIGMGYFGMIEEVTLTSWYDVKKSHIGLASVVTVCKELNIIKHIADAKKLNDHHI
jgi:glycosyltransferase involved in cell wall biosynthesis